MSRLLQGQTWHFVLQGSPIKSGIDGTHVIMVVRTISMKTQETDKNTETRTALGPGRRR
jgi:hypothetical protein